MENAPPLAQQEKNMKLSWHLYTQLQLFIIRKCNALSTFRYVQDFEATLLDNKDKTGDVTGIVGNPVQAFKLMRRFTVDIPNIEKDLKQDDWKGLCHPSY